MFWAGTPSAQKTLIGLTRGKVGHVIEYDLTSESLNTPPVTTGNALPWYNDLIQAKDGKLYGMTESGGKYGKGTIFSYDPVTNDFVPRFEDFGKDASHPASPFGSLLEINGAFYGMTESGGAHGFGTIFSFNPLETDDTKRVTVLHSFDGANGRSPFGSLIQDDNKLYGVTESGGLNDFGTIFSYDLSGSANSQYSVLHHFELLNGKPSNGRSPYGSLIKFGDVLYGTAQFGGANGYGVLFSYSSNRATKYQKVDFNWTNGAWPNSTLVLVDNILYGTAESGGANNYGVIYSYVPGSTSITSLMSFDGANGRSPYGKLVKVSNTNLLYGLTFRGGAEDKGILYSIIPGATSLSNTVSFNGTNGMNPAASLIEYTTPIALPLSLISFTARNDNNKVQLYWDVEREFDIVRYEVERSGDGINYATIGAVTAINSQNRHHYVFTDKQPTAGNNYYRLKIIERYKAPHYSNIRLIKADKAAFDVTVQPNPITANSTIKLNLQATGRVKMALYNAQGARLKQWPDVTLDKGEHDVPLRLTDFPNGSYILVVETDDGKQALQLIKGAKNL